MDKTPRLVVVELYDDAELTAQEAAREIVANVEEARRAYPAYSDGFGNIVKAGDEVTA